MAFYTNIIQRIAFHNTNINRKYRTHGAPLSEVFFILGVKTVTSDIRCLINAYFILFIYITYMMFLSKANMLSDYI